MKKDDDLDWPTFSDGEDIAKVNYSPDAEQELIFKGFVPKTDRKKKKKKKSPVLRLVSGMELHYIRPELLYLVVLGGAYPLFQKSK